MPAVSAWEYAARMFEPPVDRFPTPGALAQHIDPRIKQTPALDVIDAAIVDTLNTPDGRLLISMPPQEGKSQRTTRTTPLFGLLRNPDLRVAIVGYELGVARRWGRAIRDDITMHPDLGLTVRDDISAQQEWQLTGHDGGVYSAGIAGALTGRPVDLLIVDDPFKDRVEAESKVYRERAWTWWTDVGGPRLAPGAPVIVIQTRWHQDDLIGKLLSAPDGAIWTVVNIPAQADHDPAKGETDVLGREPGEFMVSARGRTEKQWEAIKVRSGSRTWNALYQGRPSPGDGDVWLRSWWRQYDTVQWIERDDGSRWIPGNGVEVITSWDMAFKDTDSSDYVVGTVLARRANQVFVIDQVRRRISFTETVRAVRDLAARWPQSLVKLVEDKANGTAVINALRLSVSGLIPVEPDGSKIARAAAVAPFIEAGQVWLPDPTLPGCAWAVDLVEEAAMFPNGTHDDQVDALSQGLNRLLLSPLLTEDVVIEPDDFTNGDTLISPY